MTNLQKRMIESLQLRGLAKRTQENYIAAVGQLAQHYHKWPDLVTEEELRQDFLYIKNVKKYSRATATIALCGIKFFIEWTLVLVVASDLIPPKANAATWSAATRRRRFLPLSHSPKRRRVAALQSGSRET